MQVPLLDLKQQHAALGEELRAAVGRVFDSQQFILGEDVRLREEELARYSRTKHAVGCGSGSDALLLALDIREGDEVVTTPFAFFATAGAIARAGAQPRFVDIEPRTYNLDPALLEGAITPRTATRSSRTSAPTASAPRFTTPSRSTSRSASATSATGPATSPSPSAPPARPSPSRCTPS